MIKAKKARLKLSEVRKGLVCYKVHPGFYMSKLKIVGHQYTSKYGGHDFIPAKVWHRGDNVGIPKGWSDWDSSISVSCFEGGTEQGTSYWKVFRKEKQALAWAEMTRKSEAFQAHMERHREFVKSIADFPLENSLDFDFKIGGSDDNLMFDNILVGVDMSSTPSQIDVRNVGSIGHVVCDPDGSSGVKKNPSYLEWKKGNLILSGTPNLVDGFVGSNREEDNEE